MYETMQKFSDRTGITYNAIRNMCIKNEIPFIWIGNRRLIHVEVAEKILSDRSRGVLNESVL